ncbi:MAG TPA: glycoside hydrolase family 16 protein [Thermoleophilaceae bacterium]
MWLPHYLPQWSSRALSAATYELAGSELRLTIPPEQGIWCDGEHEPPLRVSGVQSGVSSGPVGSTVGQQAFREGLVVREEQPERWGWTPQYGLIEIRARMELSPRSMASLWLSGLERRPEESGEICVFEIFGESVEGGGAGVGQGIKHFRDPSLHWEFDAPCLALDVREQHVYAARWEPERVEFLVDDVVVKTVGQAPAYPVQAMIAVFDFPEKDPAGEHAEHIPVLAVDWVRGTPA